MLSGGNDTGTVPADGDPGIPGTDPTVTWPRARAIFGWMLLAVIGVIVIMEVLWPGSTGHGASPLQDATTMLLTDSLLVLFIARMVSRARLAPVKLLGPEPGWRLSALSALTAVPLLAFSMFSLYFLYVPLSYVAPGFVTFFIIDHNMTLIWTSGPHYLVANLISFCSVVLIGPVSEEFLFRGLLLGRWAMKWNVQRAILASSAAFGLLHTNVFGTFFVGCVLAVLYIRTRSLLAPIVVHATNNCICWLWAMVEMLGSTSDAPGTLGDFQASWWLGLIAAVIAIPWAVWFTRRNIPNDNWRIPYLT